MFVRFLFVSILVATASCGSNPSATTKLQDLKLSDLLGNQHSFIYLDRASNKFKLRTCADQPIDRNCPTNQAEREMTVEDWNFNLQSLFGTINDDIDRNALNRVDAARAALRLEIATGNMSSTEIAEAQFQLAELDQSFESLQRAVFYTEQASNEGIETSISSARQDYRRLQAIFTSGTTVSWSLWLGPDEYNLKFRYMGEGPKSVAEKRCSRVHPQGGSLLSMSNYSGLSKSIDTIAATFEQYRMPITGENGGTLRESSAVGYWFNGSYRAIELSSGRGFSGSGDPDRLAIVCVVDFLKNGAPVPL
jgi:hypothetical protein